MSTPIEYAPATIDEVIDALSQAVDDDPTATAVRIAAVRCASGKSGVRLAVDADGWEENARKAVASARRAAVSEGVPAIVELLLCSGRRYVWRESFNLEERVRTVAELAGAVQRHDGPVMSYCAPDGTVMIPLAVLLAHEADRREETSAMRRDLRADYRAMSNLVGQLAKALEQQPRIMEQALGTASDILTTQREAWRDAEDRHRDYLKTAPAPGAVAVVAGEVAKALVSPIAQALTDVVKELDADTLARILAGPPKDDPPAEG